MPKGKINVYVCMGENEMVDGVLRMGIGAKNHKTVTVDRDEGVTPFMILCKHEDCEDMAHSSMYQVNQDLIPTHEWYAPDKEELSELDSATLDHCNLGGLLLRPIPEAKNAEKNTPAGRNDYGSLI